MPDAGDPLELARRALNNGDHAGALPQLQEALRQTPDSAEGSMLLGVCLWTSGSRAEGLAAAGRAVELDPDNARSRYNLAVMLGESGRVSEAATHFEAALRLDPGYQAAATALRALDARLAQQQPTEPPAQAASAIAPTLGESRADTASRLDDETGDIPPRHERQAASAPLRPESKASPRGPQGQPSEESTPEPAASSAAEGGGATDAPTRESVDRLWEEEQAFMKWWGGILDRCAGMGDVDHRGDAGRKGIVAVVTRCWRLVARHAGSRRR